MKTEQSKNGKVNGEQKEITILSALPASLRTDAHAKESICLNLRMNKSNLENQIPDLPSNGYGVEHLFIDFVFLPRPHALTRWHNDGSQ
jgi:hypothetical protein